MIAVAFDTHRFVKRLTAVGITEEQAQVFAEEQVRLINDELATKRDLKELEGALKSDIEIRIRESELRMLKWFVPLLLVQGGLTAALVKWIL